MRQTGGYRHGTIVHRRTGNWNTKTGLLVIQFKHCIKNGISIVTYVLSKCIIAFKSAFDNMCECLIEAMDNIQYIFDTVKNCLGYPTSRRYRFVKILGNFGYRKYDAWVATRTYLARSNCWFKKFFKK